MGIIYVPKKYRKNKSRRGLSAKQVAGRNAALAEREAIIRRCEEECRERKRLVEMAAEAA